MTKKRYFSDYRPAGASTALQLSATAPRGTITTHEGWLLNLASPIWEFPKVHLTIDWRNAPMTNPSLLNSTKRFVAWMAVNRAEGTLRIAWESLNLLSKCPSFIDADKRTKGADGTITCEVFQELAQVLSSKSKSYQNKFGLTRTWYKWCLDRRYLCFSDSEWPSIHAIDLGQREPYRALLGPGPDETPLTPTQKRELFEALKTARTQGTLPIEHLVVVWLVFYRGIRPEEATNMIEADLKRAGNQFMVWVPYAKKRTPKRKGGGRNLRIPPFLGTLIEKMILQHRKARTATELPDPTSERWPLFPRETPDTATYLDPMANWFQRKGILVIWILRAGIKMGLSFKMGAHRLRNTFALDLVANGACPEELRIELGHESTNWIHRYFHPGDSQVDMLDVVESERLGTVLQSLTANMTDSYHPRRPNEAPRTRIRYGDPTKGIYVGVGECGCKGSKCAVGLANTLNCYVCVYFCPFWQGAHELVLRQVNDTIDEMRLRGAEEADLAIWRQYRKGAAHVIELCHAAQSLKARHTEEKPNKTRKKEKKNDT